MLLLFIVYSFHLCVFCHIFPYIIQLFCIIFVFFGCSTAPGNRIAIFVSLYIFPPICVFLTFSIFSAVMYYVYTCYMFVVLCLYLPLR